jgi:hypothetical protein
MSGVGTYARCMGAMHKGSCLVPERSSVSEPMTDSALDQDSPVKEQPALAPAPAPEVTIGEVGFVGWRVVAPPVTSQG